MAPFGRRRPADAALEQARKAQRRPTLPSASRGERIQDTYTAYDDFPWEEIEEYLRGKWPDWDFKRKRVRRVFILQYFSLIVCAVPRQMGF